MEHQACHLLLLKKKTSKNEISKKKGKVGWLAQCCREKHVDAMFGAVTKQNVINNSSSSKPEVAQAQTSFEFC